MRGSYGLARVMPPSFAANSLLKDDLPLSLTASFLFFFRPPRNFFMVIVCVLLGQVCVRIPTCASRKCETKAEYSLIVSHAAPVTERCI